MVGERLNGRNPVRSCRVLGCPTGSSCTGDSDYSTAEADKTGKSSSAKAVCASFLALTGGTIPLSSFRSFALLFFYTGFALIFLFFSQLLGLQVKANSVEFAGSFAIKASQDLTEVHPGPPHQHQAHGPNCMAGHSRMPS